VRIRWRKYRANTERERERERRRSPTVQLAIYFQNISAATRVHLNKIEREREKPSAMCPKEREIRNAEIATYYLRISDVPQSRATITIYFHVTTLFIYFGLFRSRHSPDKIPDPRSRFPNLCT